MFVSSLPNHRLGVASGVYFAGCRRAAEGMAVAFCPFAALAQNIWRGVRLLRAPVWTFGCRTSTQCGQALTAVRDWPPGTGSTIGGYDNGVERSGQRVGLAHQADVRRERPAGG